MTEPEDEHARRLSVCGILRFLDRAVDQGGMRLMGGRGGTGRDLWVGAAFGGCVWGRFAGLLCRGFPGGCCRCGMGGGGVGGLRRSGRVVKGGVGMGAREKRVRFLGMASREEFQKFWERWRRKELTATGDEMRKGMRGPHDVWGGGGFSERGVDRPSSVVHGEIRLVNTMRRGFQREKENRRSMYVSKSCCLSHSP